MAGWNLVAGCALDLQSMAIGGHRIPQAVALEIDIGIDLRACRRADHVGVGNLQTGKSVAIRVGGEIAGAHRHRRDKAGEGNCMALVFLFAIDEEKGPILANRSADGAAKLV